MITHEAHCRQLIELIERFDTNTTELPQGCVPYLVERFWEQTERISQDFEDVIITESCASVNVRNNCLKEEMQLFVYFFPLLLLLCSYGNAMNIIVYHRQQLRSSSTIRLLEMRAFANTAFVWSMVPTMVFAYETLTQSQTFSDLYWASKPYLLTIINGFGTFATL